MKVSDAVIIAALATVPPTLTGIAALVVSLRASAKLETVSDKVEVVHKATNSLTDKLVAATRSDALQKGHSAGVADQKQVQKAKEK